MNPVAPPPAAGAALEPAWELWIPKRLARVPQILQIRGVEYEAGVGRISVVRFLCDRCCRFFRSRELADEHECEGMKP